MKRDDAPPPAADVASLGALERMHAFVVGGDVASSVATDPDVVAPAERAAPPPPVIDRYRIDSEIGRGATSTVLRAFDREGGAWVALKVLRPPSEAATGPRESAERIERFERECRLLALGLHPRIVRGLGHGVLPSGELYVAMELLDGCTLEQRLRHGPLPVDETAAVLRCVCEALATLHARRMVHRDVKPSNLFLREGAIDDVVLLDFGLLRAADGAPRTAPDLYLGTPGYAAPEQIVSPRVDARADVFALGVVAYRCLTGQLPFPDDGSSAVHRATLYAEPPPLSALGVQVPAALERVVLRALHKRPSERFADGAAMLRALDGELRAPSSAGDAALTGYGDIAVTSGRLVQRGPHETRAIEAARRERRKLERAGVLVAVEASLDGAIAAIVPLDDLEPLPRSASLPWEAFVVLLAQLDRDLGAAHAARVVHGDIARRWLWIGPRGARLLGWGFQRGSAAGSARDERASVAPEHVELAVGLKSPAADVFALGSALSDKLPEDMPATWARRFKSALAREPQSRPRAGAWMAALDEETEHRGREQLRTIFRWA